MTGGWVCLFVGLGFLLFLVLFVWGSFLIGACIVTNVGFFML